jgi:hypothetical protein
VSQEPQLPGGYTLETLQRDYAATNECIAGRSDLRERLNQRRLIVAELGRMMVETGVLRVDQLANLADQEQRAWLQRFSRSAAMWLPQVSHRRSTSGGPPR